MNDPALPLMEKQSKKLSETKSVKRCEIIFMAEAMPS